MRILLILLTLPITPSLAGPQPGAPGAIIRLDPALDRLIAPGTTIEVLASGHDWAEGPVWDRQNKRLLFSDVPRNTIYQWSEKDGESIYLKPSGFTGPADYSREPGSNGLAFDLQGRLLCCEHGDRRVSVLTTGGGKRTLADNWQGKRLNSPNDLAVHPNGSIYFTDPPYGLPQGAKDPLRELDFCGVFRIAPDGSVSLVDRSLDRPNGIALSHDGKFAFVAQSDGQAPILKRYRVQDDGSFADGRIFFDLTGIHRQDRGGPDGLKLDQAGNVWCTGARGILVISPAGTLLGRIRTGVATANCAWGDDGSTLYLTADSHLCRVKTLARGAGW